MKLSSDTALKQHPRALMLRAIADGSTLEFKTDYTDDVWHTVDSEDALRWYVETGTKSFFDWRIKPEPAPDVKEKLTRAYGVNGFYIKFHEIENYDRPNLELTFDGETKKLKAVKILDAEE